MHTGGETIQALRCVADELVTGPGYIMAMILAQKTNPSAVTLLLTN